MTDSPEGSTATLDEEDARFDAAFREAAVRELSVPPPAADEDGPPARSSAPLERRAAYQRLVLGIVGTLGLFVLAVLALSLAGCLPR